MSDDNTMLLVGAALLVGAFFAFNDKKDKSTTDGDGDTPMPPAGGEEIVDLTGDPDGKPKTIKGGGKRAFEGVEADTLQQKQQEEVNQLNHMIHPDGKQQAELDQLADWGVFLDLKASRHGIFPFSAEDRKDLQRYLALMRQQKRRYEKHAEALASVTRMISPMSRVTAEQILHNQRYDYTKVLSNIHILEVAAIRNDQARQIQENQINSVTYNSFKQENHMNQVKNSEKLIFNQDVINAQSQMISNTIVNTLQPFVAAQDTRHLVDAAMDDTSGSSGAKRPAGDVESETGYDGLDGAPKDGLETQIAQRNTSVLRKSLVGGEKALKDPASIPKEPVYIDAIAEGFNTDGKATTRIREEREMYPNAPEYMSRMGYSEPKKPGKRKRIESDKRSTAKVSKVTTQLFDKAKRGDGNVNALSNKKQLVPASLFNSTNKTQQMIKENTEVGATYLQRVRETGARFQVLARRSKTPEAALGLAFCDLRETAPEGSQQGQLGNPITMEDGSVQVGRITVPLTKWFDMYKNPQKYQARIQDRAAITSQGYQAYKAAMDKAKQTMHARFTNIYSREEYESMETR